MVEKMKLSLKHLDTNIDTEYNYFTSYTMVFWSYTLAKAKSTAFTIVQAHIVKAKAVI